MQKSRISNEYDNGVLQFLEFTLSDAMGRNKLSCFCVCCNNCLMRNRETMHHHLLDNGIARNYVCWLMHGEYEIDELKDASDEFHMDDDMQGMLHDAFKCQILMI